MVVPFFSFTLSLLICVGIWLGRIPSPYSYASDRSLHDSPVPRGGGLGISAAILGGFVLQGSPWPVLLSCFVLWAISAWDDWAQTSAAARLAVQAIAVLLIAFVWLNLSPTFTLLLSICLIWALNLFNFMDGADGIAAATALNGGLALALYAWLAPGVSGTTLSAMSLVVTAAAAGFILLNLPPARIFMGDGGSTVLGFALATISVKGTIDGLWPWVLPFVLFMPFWVDATYTLICRILTGHHPLRAHRNHLYQRLVLAGLGHRGLLCWILGWNLLSAIASYWLRNEFLAGGLTFAALYSLAYITITEWTLRQRPNLLINPRAFLALLYDLIAAAATWSILFWARFNFNIDAAVFTIRDVLRSLTFVIPVHALVFVCMGLYHGLWRFASLPDLRRLVVGAFLAAALTAMLFAIVRPDSFIWPRSVLLLQPLFLIVLMGGARLAYRSWKEHRLYGLTAARGEPVIVLGAGSAGARLVSELARSETWRVVALLDDDPGKVGARVHNTPVSGNLQQVGVIARRFSARHAIVAMPSAEHAARRRAVVLAAEAGLKPLTVPSYDELMGKNSPLAKLRDIELEDLLGRDPVTLDTQGLGQWLSERTILVTGAGGSIGTELCVQVARFRPRRLILLDISEFAAHAIFERMSALLPLSQLEVYVGDVRNRTRMMEILKRERPQVIFHAAAYKHVPLTESVNAWEAVCNNALGTIVAADCARAVNVEKFVLISTDKAVRASSIMGASKRLAELACMNYPEQPTQFIGVRFGNVLGSNGSVIPKFQQQIAAGGPITVTHLEMTRYFMSIPEAAQLVIQAGLIGEARSLYVLDMGEPVRIVELAQELIRLAKGTPDAVPIVFTGLRPGEKMHEELTGNDEHFVATRHHKVRRVVSHSTVSPINIASLQRWLEGDTPQDVHAALKQWVMDFSPPNTH